MGDRRHRRTKTVLAAAVLLCAGAGASCSGPQSAAAPAATPAQLQRACEARALKAFPDFHETPGFDVFRTATDRYSAPLRRCFVLLRTMAMDLSHNGGMSADLELRDVDGARYGVFAAYTDVIRKTERVDKCELTPPAAPKSACQSRAQWDAFVAGYMGPP